MKTFVHLILYLILSAEVLEVAPRADDSRGTGAVQVHATRGLVRSMAPDRKKAVIRHEAIPDYMPAMTMELNVKDANELKGIQAGETITFRLLADETTHWIDTVRRVAVTQPPTLEPASPPPRNRIVELKPGDELPDMELQSEKGVPIRISGFRGQAVAFTFIFTRCPLPDFCPLMGRNFAKARNLLLADAQAPTNWQFLSISFDADYDQPNVLARYAKNYRGSRADRWLFAAAATNALAALAPRLDLMIGREGASFSHNLRTIVLDPRGHIHRQFDGNQWTAEQLAAAMCEASRAVP